MLDQNDFLELALARPGSEIHKNRIRRLIGSRIADPAKGKHHKHHIAPASWHPEHAKNKKNLVRLTHREHFVIHKMLHRAFPEDVCMSTRFSFDVYIRRRIVQGNTTIRQFKAIQRIA